MTFTATSSEADADLATKQASRLHRLSKQLITFLALTLLVNCAGPPVLEQQVLGYDEVTRALDNKLLLLNIARVDNQQSIHFTTTSSIAATFNWTTTVGVGGQLEEPSGVDFFNFNLGASASENPTFSIFPVSGEEFTKRLATPFRDTVFESVVFQGGRINQVMRLLASGVEVQTPEGRFIRFIENDPRRPKEYREFRRIAAHLQWLNDQRKLFVRSLVFKETLVENFTSVPRAEDIVNGFDKGLRWRQKPDGNYELTRLKAGRVIVTNYDPATLTNQQRSDLNDRIRENPAGFVYLDIRPDGPGGDFAIQGAIKLRSMIQILKFVAKGIRAAEEFDVTPDPRTGGTIENPVATIKIVVTDTEPETNAPSIAYQGQYYTVNDTYWDRTSFEFLNYFFQTAVGEVEDVGIPITISK